MASRRQQAVLDWDRAQADDLRNLPHATRLVRPGSFGTYPERTRVGGPQAPTLDDGPLYTGEDREEVDGNVLKVPLSVDGAAVRTVQLAVLRRPWPYVGFAIDTSDIPGNATVIAGLVVMTRSGPAQLLGSVVGGTPAPLVAITQTGIAAPFPWVALSGIYAGARIAVYATQTQGGESVSECSLKANLWGYNAPGFGA